MRVVAVSGRHLGDVVVSVSPSLEDISSLQVCAANGLGVALRTADTFGVSGEAIRLLWFGRVVDLVVLVEICAAAESERVVTALVMTQHTQSCCERRVRCSVCGALMKFFDFQSHVEKDMCPSCRPVPVDDVDADDIFLWRHTQCR